MGAKNQYLVCKELSKGMAKRKTRRRRTFSEKVMIVLSVLIALSMIVGLFAAFAPQALGG
jgi:hypothetical protein